MVYGRFVTYYGETSFARDTSSRITFLVVLVKYLARKKTRRRTKTNGKKVSEESNHDNGTVYNLRYGFRKYYHRVSSETSHSISLHDSEDLNNSNIVENSYH